MKARFGREDSGQALVIVALSFVALLGGVALAVDWGHGLTQRRVMINSAEAGALAGAKLLAMNVVTDANATPSFTVTEHYVYCVALNAATANRDYRPGAGLVETTIVEWNTDPQRRDPVTNEPIYTEFSRPATPCPSPGTAVTSGPIAQAAARYVRVRTGVTYRPLLASVLGQSSITARGVGAARITGAQTGEPGPTWPFMRHYNQDDFNTACQAQCNPGNAEPVIFWDSNDEDLSYGNQSKGIVDFSRYSPMVQSHAPPAEKDNCGDAPTASCVPQLMESWDQRGSLPAFPGTQCSPPAPAGQWYTRGNETSSLNNKACSIPNWGRHLFGGELSLAGDHTGIVWDGVTEHREAPSGLSASRQVCTTTIPVEKPSCDDPTVGDWVEIAASGNLGDNVASPLRAFIASLGQRDEWYNRPLPGNQIYGHYAVITIYLWDCAEWYDPGAAGGERWSLTLPKQGSDCSDIHRNNDLARGHQVNRVHVFTAVPFTFYEGLVDGSSIRGFWGGRIGDSTSCQAVPTPPNCGLNAVSNGVYLVPPD